jgi:hypothetical protein
MKRIYLSCFFMLLLFSFIVNAQTPVAYYPFNGNANDAIGTNNGTANGGAALTNDRFGNANSAYNFDGVNDFISTANLATNQTDNWTMLAWVKPSSISQFQGSILLNGFDNGLAGSNGFSMVMSDNAGSNGNLLMGYFGGIAIHSSGGVFGTNNIWYHVAMLRQSGTVKYYINGVQTGNTYIGGINIPSGSVLIGAQNGHRFWSGAIDEVKIYNTALTALQVQQDFASSNQLQKPGSGNAISFDGVDDHIALGDVNQVDFGTGNFSIDCWVKLNDWPTVVQIQKAIIRKGATLPGGTPPGSGYIIRTRDDHTIEFETRTIGGVDQELHSAVDALELNKWYHITATRNGLLMSLYINGILVNSVNTPSLFDVSTSMPLTFGALDNTAGISQFFSGGVDEIRFWNTALTQSQIRDRMCKKITSTDPLYSNLVSYYNFDESTGTTAFDGTVNANNGTLTNTPARVTSGAAIGNASSHDYVNATKTVSLTHASGENLTVSSTSGLPAGIQVYMVDEKPNTLTGASGVGDNNKYFGVFQAGGTTPQYTAVYNYNGNPFVTPAIESQLRLNKRTDNAAASWTTMVAIPNEPANTITVTGESTEYILGKLGAPLPLSLISFTGSKNNNDALLQWKTANEIGVSKFEVQRSTNGQTFETIGTVAAGGSLYSLTDANAFSSRTVVYYRLKSIDTDGRVTYSSIIKLTTQTSAAITIYPNPVSDVLTIAGLKQNGTITLYNQEGKLLQQQTVSAQTTTMDMSKYAKGIYLLQYKTADEVVNQKIIKQ